MKQALQACGVGSVESRLEGIFSTPDAQELARVLQAVAEPTREGTLRTGWATTLVGLQADEVERLGADESALARWIERLAGWRQVWLQRGGGVMLRQWMAQEGVAARLLARPDGERRLTNLLHLVETLQGASVEHPSPAALLRWLEHQRREGPAHDELQLRLESDANLVQIQTIHGAKGLEYPVVVCPFLWDGRLQDPPDDLGCRSWHDDEGHSVLDLGEADASVKARLQRERAAERMRLLYVALTRAINRCVLVVGCYTTGGSATRAGSPNESLRSLLHWLVEGAAWAPEDWFGQAKGRSPEAMEQAWQALAARMPQALTLSHLADAPAVPLRGAEPRAQGPTAREAPAAVPRGMRLSSYSQLVKRATADAPGTDHDERTRTRPGPPPGHAPEPDDILGFPASAEAGQCIHTVFELIDFQDASGWDAAIARALARFARIGPAAAPRAGAGQAPGHASLAPRLRRMLHDVLHTELPVGTARPLRLADVPARQRLPELAFHFPTAGIALSALTARLAAHGYTELASLSAGTLGRYLTGAIDLVFAHEGRYFIADWKSNLLGHTPAHYGMAQVAQEMAAERYRLQYLLYTVALHRHLQRCLPGYEPAAHLGGSLYLFVRGVRPGWQDDSGHPAGLHFDRPDPALVEGLSALLGGQPATPGAAA
ncbi:MAG: 3'-5' exonuclease [Rubrivivax sp.]